MVPGDQGCVSPSKQTLGTLLFKEETWSRRLTETAKPRPQESRVQGAAFALAPGHVCM